MNRNERRLARKLDAHWVKIRHNGTAEICFGGGACGCGSDDGARAPATSTARPGVPEVVFVEMVQDGSAQRSKDA